MTLLALLACAGTDVPAESTPAPLDLRLVDGDYPETGDDAFEWWGPEVTVQPGEDVMWCLFGTYTGPDVGIHTFDIYQNAFGHHLQLMGTTASDLDYPDGTVMDCTATGSLPMADLEPLALPTGGNIGEIELALPEGMAVKLDEGQRWVIQAHYLNTSTDAFLAEDVAIVGTLAEDAVTTWAAPLVMNRQAFEVPPAEEASVTFDCAFEQDYTVLYMLGHMHEWGTAYKVEQLDDQGAASTVYEVPEWSAEYRDSPPVSSYADGEWVLPAGTPLRTTCSWFNDTDETLVFPHEMCATVGVVYPALTPDICSD